MCHAAASGVLDKMRVGSQGRLRCTAAVETPPGLRLGGWVGKRRRAVRLLPGPGRGLRPTLQRRGGQPKMAVPRGLALRGESGQAETGAGRWSGHGGEEGWQGTENTKVTNYINKLDKDTLNLYTAARAYG